MTVGFPKVLLMCTLFWHSSFDPKPQFSYNQKPLLICHWLFWIIFLLFESSVTNFFWVCGNTLIILHTYERKKKGFFPMVKEKHLMNDKKEKKKIICACKALHEKNYILLCSICLFNINISYFYFSHTLCILLKFQ